VIAVKNRDRKKYDKKGNKYYNPHHAFYLMDGTLAIGNLPSPI
jgi:hypothetical protein